MTRLRVVGGEVDARYLRIMDGATLDASGCQLSNSGRISLAGSTISSGTVTFEGAEIHGGHLELDKAKIEGNGVLNLSHVRITSVLLAGANWDRPSPLTLDEAVISSGTVNLESIRITTGPDRLEATWSGGRKNGGGRLAAASFNRLNLTDGRISFSGTKIPSGKFSFNNADFSGGVLDFEGSILSDCCLDFSGAKIKGGHLNFSNSHIGASPSSDASPRSGFAYEWIEDLKSVKDVSDRCMNRKERPYGVVMFWDAELSGGNLNFDGAIACGALLQFSGMRASGGKIALTGLQFEALTISFWNADLSGECEIEIRSRHHPPFPDVTVLYSRAYGGLNDRVVRGDRIELLEVSAVD